MRGPNEVEFDQDSNEHGLRHMTHLFALLLAKIANERLKILTSLLFDLHTSVRHQNGVEFHQESTGQIFPSPFIGQDSQRESENPNFLVI